MKTIIILFLSAFLCKTLAEPVRYRAQLVRTSARQTNGEVPMEMEFGKTPNEEPQNDDEDLEATTEPSLTKSAPAPGPVPGPVFYPQPPQAYPPQGWRPFGQLLVLPVAVRENLESTTTVDSRTFNDAETTEETPSTESQSRTNEEPQEVETSEPKIKKTEAHKRPTVIIIKGKKFGELKVESKQETNEDSNETNETETNSSTTENSDDATTTDSKSENLETTAEPEAESVDVEKSNEEGKNVNSQMPETDRQAAFFVQLSDGTFQRVVYVAPQPPTAFIPQAQPASNTQIQQLNQAPSYAFGFNPITNPRIVTFSTQYNAW